VKLSEEILLRQRGWLWLPLAASLHSAVAAAALPETPVLSQREYRTPLEEILVQGPYWRRQKAAEQPGLQLQEQDKSRLQWAPRYTREERDDAQQMRDRMNPPPRVKLFELKF
jgi:hypothetical protein